jgi:4-deoxy-L-threo-5-hexosulose-uronate ketol-isomerase
VRIGDAGTASARSLYRYVWGGGHPSCRLQFGVTVVDAGSVWNTMPAHLHDRRTEVYLYTGLPADARVVHLLGRPGATRHLMVADRQAVIAPAWSVHAGAGTSPCAFIWAMSGENTDYGDLQGVPMEAL